MEERPEPTPGHGEALVRVRAVGLCGTDLKLSAGDFAATTPLPLIPGHEIAGELAEAVENLPAGTRVACHHNGYCGHCSFCHSSRPTLCANLVRLGLERDGGLADLVAVPQTNLLAFGDGLSFDAAAVAMDAVTTPWGALHGSWPVESGEAVLVVGAGGLGLNGIQIARHAGARVAALDPVASHRELAAELGAELAVGGEEIAQVLEWSEGGVDLALDSSGASAGFSSALAAVRRGGRVICCGYRPGVDYGFDSGRLVLEELSILGSRSASLNHSRRALKAVENGEVQPPIMERVPLAAVNEALARLKAGEVLGRIVVEI